MTNLSVSAIIKIQRNPDNTLAEKHKKSTHRVVVRGTLCVFKILIKKEKEGHYDYTT